MYQMAAKKRKKSEDKWNRSDNFDLEPIMHFEELSFEQCIKMLADSGFDLSEEEAVELILFLNTIAKVTLKEVLSSK